MEKKEFQTDLVSPLKFIRYLGAAPKELECRYTSDTASLWSSLKANSWLDKDNYFHLLLVVFGFGS